MSRIAAASRRLAGILEAEAALEMAERTMRPPVAPTAAMPADLTRPPG